MQIIVKSLSGGQHKINVESDDKVSYLKQAIMEKTGLSIVQQRLVRNGRILPDDKSLHEEGITSGDAIQLILQLKGGAQ